MLLVVWKKSEAKKWISSMQPEQKCQTHSKTEVHPFFFLLLALTRLFDYSLLPSNEQKLLTFVSTPDEPKMKTKRKSSFDSKIHWHTETSRSCVAFKHKSLATHHCVWQFSVCPDMLCLIFYKTCRTCSFLTDFSTETILDAITSIRFAANLLTVKVLLWKCL